MFGSKSSFELRVNCGFFRMNTQIVPERQPLPHLAMQLRNMHVVRTFRSKGRHTLDAPCTGVVPVFETLGRRVEEVSIDLPPDVEGDLFFLWCRKLATLYSYLDEWGYLNSNRWWTSSARN